jgi:hypothetical protein
MEIGYVLSNKSTQLNFNICPDESQVKKFRQLIAAVVELQFCNIVIASATKQPRPAFTSRAGMSGKRKSWGSIQLLSSVK